MRFVIESNRQATTLLSTTYAITNSEMAHYLRENQSAASKLTLEELLTRLVEEGVAHEWEDPHVIRETVTQHDKLNIEVVGDDWEYAPNNNEQPTHGLGGGLPGTAKTCFADGSPAYPVCPQCWDDGAFPIDDGELECDACGCRYCTDGDAIVDITRDGNRAITEAFDRGFKRGMDTLDDSADREIAQLRDDLADARHACSESDAKVRELQFLLTHEQKHYAALAARMGKLQHEGIAPVPKGVGPLRETLRDWCGDETTTLFELPLNDGLVWVVQMDSERTNNLPELMVVRGTYINGEACVSCDLANGNSDAVVATLTRLFN